MRFGDFSVRLECGSVPVASPGRLFPAAGFEPKTNTISELKKVAVLSPVGIPSRIKAEKGTKD